MKISELFENLHNVEKKWGDIDVTLDDYYTPAALDIDYISVEPRQNAHDAENVAVIRS